VEIVKSASAKVLISRRIFPDFIERLRARFEVRDNQDDAQWSALELARRVAEVDAILLDPTSKLDAATIASCPQLRLVSNIAVGYNNVDVAACTQAGIPVTNTPDVLTDATADHAWALLMAAARRVVETDRWTRAGKWQRFGFDSFLGAQVHGATLGIYGMGRIGRAIAQRARGFAMRTIYHNRHAPPPGADAELARWVTRDELLQTSDFLVLVVPYSAQTHHLIGAAELACMKEGSILINIARGGVVDDAALAQALRKGRPAGAALDVMENEPNLEPALLELENIVLTPHIGSATRSARRGMVQLAVENLEAVASGRRPDALVNPEVWERRRHF
jgi:glyoxylate reductase